MAPNPAILANLRWPERTAMRTVRHAQMEIGEARIEDIEPDPKSWDDMPALLTEAMLRPLALTLGPEIAARQPGPRGTSGRRSSSLCGMMRPSRLVGHPTPITRCDWS